MSSLNHQKPIPTLFLAHGSPMNAIAQNRYTQDWVDLAKPIQNAAQRPKAILCVSAHWCTRGIWVSSAEQQDTIHDFSGFPPMLYGVSYPCPGDPELAEKVCDLLQAWNVQKDAKRGLDHGSWGVLTQLYPDANIPVVQLSLDLTLPAQTHWDIAKALRPLREQGVLIIGSGNIVHNIPKWAANPNGPIDWAVEFDQYIAKAIEQGDKDALIQYDKAPYWNDAVPTPEHYLPLIYALAPTNFAENPADVAMSAYLNGYSNSSYSDLEEACMRSLRCN